MKRLIATLALTAAMLLPAGAAFAAGMPAAHGVDGRTFGGAVSSLSVTNPLGLAAHVSGR